MELDRPDIEDEEARFLTWENTILVKAASLDSAYGKVEAIARDSLITKEKKKLSTFNAIAWDFSKM